jgi:uncharacterized protein (TIGR02722 family)
MKFSISILLFSLGVGLSACGPKAFTDGQYDDPNKVILLDDQFNENDMQLVSNQLVTSLQEFGTIKYAEKRPLVMVGTVRNRTSEHIDIKALTDKIRTELIKSGKFRFADRSVRDEVAEEYEYQSGGFVDQQSAVKKGKQIGVQYLITGDVSSNIQEVGRDKVIYYQVTMNLIDLETNVIEWSDRKEIRKRYRKQTISN